MKKLLSSTLLCLLTAFAAHSQAPAPGAPLAPAAPIATIPSRPPKVADTNLVASDAPKLTRFNLNFPGGNPQQLVAAIEKAMGKPLNIIIPDEFANESIPALRMNQVTVAELFRAMEQASMVTIPYRTGAYYGGGTGTPSYSYQQMRTSLTFQTAGPLSDDSVWYFRGRDKAPDPSVWGEVKVSAPAKTCRFYALTPYLEQGLKVEDITTAIQTGWKMLGDKETPSISFHKETKLLIAVGEPGKLETIDAVLNALRPGVQLPAGASFSDRVRALMSEATPAPTKIEAPNPKPAAPAEKKP